jgi:hypothetical protein
MRLQLAKRLSRFPLAMPQDPRATLVTELPAEQSPSELIADLTSMLSAAPYYMAMCRERTYQALILKYRREFSRN